MKRPGFEEAKRKYVHRFTMEHVPAWALKDPGNPRADGKPCFYAPQYRTDREWYDNTTFPGEAGHDGDECHCYASGQTWPLGKWLDRPYRKA